MSYQITAYWVCFVLALAFGTGVVLARRPIHSLVSLIGVMIAVAGIFLLAGSELLAVIQVLVYAGAVVVLFLFVIMLLSLREGVGAPSSGRWRVPFAGLMVVVFVLLTTVSVLSVLRLTLAARGPTIERLDGRATAPAPEAFAVAPSATLASHLTKSESTEDVARLILTDYLAPFELVSLLLLLAIVAVVAVIRATQREETP